MDQNYKSILLTILICILAEDQLTQPIESAVVWISFEEGNLDKFAFFYF